MKFCYIFGDLCNIHVDFVYGVYLNVYDINMNVLFGFGVLFICFLFTLRIG